MTVTTESIPTTNWASLESPERVEFTIEDFRQALQYMREWVGETPSLNFGNVSENPLHLKFATTSLLDEELQKLKKLETLQKFNNIIEVFKRVYTNPDLIDFQTNEDGFYIEVYCHFPEIWITNSKKMHHKIVDLYVIYKITPRDKGIRMDIRGFRHRLSKEEANRNYCHSHLNINGEFFCLGNGEVTVLKSSLYEEYNEDTLELLLETFNSALHWESLEGTPYHHISYFHRSPQSGHIYNPDANDEFYFFKSVSNIIEKNSELIIPLVRPVSEENLIRIDDRLLEEFKIFLKNQIIDDFTKDIINQETVEKLLFIQEYDHRGKLRYRTLRSEISRPRQENIDTNPRITFKGETLIPCIISSPSENKSLIDYLKEDPFITIYTPYLLNYFTLFLNYAIYKNTTTN